MTNKSAKTVFQLGADALSKIARPRKHSQAVDEEKKGGRAFLDELEAIVERTEALSSNETRAALSALSDDIRFSNPVSALESAADEKALLDLANGMLAAVEAGDEIPDESIEKARRLLAARNAACKQSK